MKITKAIKLGLPILLLVFIISTSVSFYFMNGTLAKFVIFETASATARVAQWGMVITESVQSGDFLFEDEYFDDKGDTNLPEGTILVAKADSAIVAPAAQNSFTINVNGTAEVKSRLSFNSKSSKLVGGWHDSHGTPYEPIVWTVTLSTDGGAPVSLLEKGSLDEFKATMNSTTKTYEPGVEVHEVFTITWVWEVLDEYDPGYEIRNQKDTALGLNGDDLDIEFNLVTSMTQVA